MILGLGEIHLFPFLSKLPRFSALPTVDQKHMLNDAACSKKQTYSVTLVNCRKLDVAERVSNIINHNINFSQTSLFLAAYSCSVPAWVFHVSSFRFVKHNLFYPTFHACPSYIMSVMAYFIICNIFMLIRFLLLSDCS